jgi:hypothetical protein
VAPFALLGAFLPLDLLGTIFRRSQTSGGDFRFNPHAAIAYLGAAVCLVLVYRSLRRTAPETSFVGMFLLLTTAPPAGWYAFGVALVPQPYRYHHEFELAVALTASLAIAHLLRRFPAAAVPVTAATALTALLLAPVGVAFSTRQLQPRTTAITPADEALLWVGRNIPPDARLMVGGELGFGLNLTLPNPQISNGHEPSSPNRAVPIGVYTIYTGQNAGARDAEISILWLKALGAKAIVVPTKKPCEACLQPFQNPAKFEGQLLKLFENDGWRIYSTGLPGHSAFRIVDQSALIRTRPLNGLDIAQIERFVSSLESRPQSLSIHQTSPSHLTVSGSFSPGEVLSFATTYSPGWRASLKSTGVPLPVHRDALDFMYLVPPPGVPCEIEWTYQGAPLGLRLLTLALRTLEIEHVQ